MQHAANNTTLADLNVHQAGEAHFQFAGDICDLIETAAKARGTGIARRDPNYIKRRMEQGHAVIALDQGKLAGFCYIETWTHGRYAVNSGLVVAPDYRRLGLAEAIKGKAFEISRRLFPAAKLFGITTSLPVMKINSKLGYKPVTFSELTRDEAFWNGCQSCPNHDVLERTVRTMCLCTGMLFDPDSDEGPTT